MRRQHWVNLGYSSDLLRYQQMAMKIENPWGREAPTAMTRDV